MVLSQSNAYDELVVSVNEEILIENMFLKMLYLFLELFFIVSKMREDFLMLIQVKNNVSAVFMLNTPKNWKGENRKKTGGEKQRTEKAVFKYN